jgi:hypothetical protein
MNYNRLQNEFNADKASKKQMDKQYRELSRIWKRFCPELNSNYNELSMLIQEKGNQVPQNSLNQDRLQFHS